MLYDSEIIEFAKTEHQKDILKKGQNCKTQKEAAKKLSISENRFSEILKVAKLEASKTGVAPTEGMNHPQPAGFGIKRLSTLHDHRNGETMLQWTIAEREEKDLYDMLNSVINEKISELKPKKPSRQFKRVIKDSDYYDHCNIVPLAYLHFGMLAWEKEVGSDFDLDIARNSTIRTVQKLMDSCQPQEKCYITNLGDLFHADNMKGTTEKSGNILDMDGRMPKIVDYAFDTIEEIIDLALKKHDEVHIFNVQGNHDELLANVTANMLKRIYRNDPRVICYDSPKHRHYFMFGNSLFGLTHGHETRDNKLPVLMASDVPELWGQAKFKYFYRGHHHHDSRVEHDGGVIVEQFRQITMPDAYATHHGFFGYKVTSQDLKLITISRYHGEVSRVTRSISIYLGEVYENEADNEKLKAS